MFDGGMATSFHTLNCLPVFVGHVNKNRTHYRTRFNSSMAIQLSSLLVQTDESGNLPESKKSSSSGTALRRYQNPNSLLCQANTVGIIGGVSVFSTLIFLEKLVWWSSRDGKECIPFVVSSDPAISRELPFISVNNKDGPSLLNHDGKIVENLRSKRAFLEQSGACCIVMPCHVSHVWHSEVSEGCCVPFLNVGDCVARELKEAKLKPLEAGSDVRIGVLATDATPMAAFYQNKLQSQGFEVVVPDKKTMEHIVIPAFEAFNRRDIEGARNLLRIAVQILLVRAVNNVILASDEFQGLLPRNDPLLKKCIDPMDALARSTIKWAQSTGKVHQQN
uniref:Putative Amino-acid racemase isoform 2 n=1 Tax=Davidia involucrata TaxID=16924 RepID=A0A5B7AZJ3_DAVIN